MTFIRNLGLTSTFLSFMAAVAILRAESGSPPAGNFPVITLQPQSQAVDYGANVTINVAASGAQLTFQWQKNGRDLADHVNISGANKSTLKLVGAALVDAADYTVIVSTPAGAITSSVARIELNPFTVFSDDFEGGHLNGWTALSGLSGLKKMLQQTPAEKKLNPISRWGMSPDATPLTSSVSQNHTPGGSASAYLNSSPQKMFHNLGVELAGATKVTFWIYDDGGEQSRSYGELRGYTGAGHRIYYAPSGLKQLFAIGSYLTGFGKNQTGTLAREVVNPKKYQAKVERGRNRGWCNLNDAPDRSVGWHKFVIERDKNGTTVRFYVDGVLGRTVTGADNVLLDCVTIGSLGGGTGKGDVWFDDVKVEGYPWRYDWQAKDSQRKGLFDWMRLRETGEDPVVTDIRAIKTVAQVGGAGFVKSLGRWEVESNSVYAAEMRGAVEYVLSAPVADAYRIEVEGRERIGKVPNVKMPLNIWVDGDYIGRFVLSADGRTNGFVHCFTPYISAGSHTVRLYWDNAASHCSLSLQAIRLQSLAGVDLNQNGFKDWVENRVLAQSGLDPVPNSSRVSPLCIEGRSPYLNSVEITSNAGSRAKPVQTLPGAGSRWYANIDLSPAHATEIRVSHQHGVLEEAAQVRWEETNLLEAKDTAIRKGDALLLNAVPTKGASGAVNIIVGGAEYVTEGKTPVVYRFEEAGVFTVTGTYLPTGASRSIVVKVIEASIGKPIAAWAGKRRFWDMENIPPGVVIDSDPSLTMSLVSREERNLQKPTPLPLGINGRQYSITNDSAQVGYVVARLGNKGPILASAAVNGFRLFNWYDTYLKYIKIHEDGSQTIEEAFVLSPMPPDITVTVRIIVSGVTFDDGTVTKTLTAADFDQLGVCRVRYIRDANVKTSVCHTTKVYQDGVLIGWPGYEK